MGGIGGLTEFRRKEEITFPKMLGNLSNFAKGLLEIVKEGNVKQARDFIEDAYWQGIDTSLDSTLMISAIIKQDIQMLKFLKHYSKPLDREAINVLEQEANNPEDLLQYYRVLRKAGIYTISKNTLMDNSKPEDGISNIKNTDIPDKWKEILSDLQGAGYDKSFIGGEGLALIDQGKDHGGIIDIFINADKDEYVEKESGVFELLNKEVSLEKVLFQLLNISMLEYNTVKLGQDSEIINPGYKISFNAKMSANIYLMGQNSEHGINSVTNNIRSASKGIAFDGINIIKSKDYIDKLKQVNAKSSLKENFNSKLSVTNNDKLTLKEIKKKMHYERIYREMRKSKPIKPSQRPQILQRGSKEIM